MQSQNVKPQPRPPALWTPVLTIILLKIQGLLIKLMIYFRTTELE